MKDRLDLILVNKGFFPSREKAKGSIMAGLIYVNGQICDKPGMAVDDTSDIYIKEVACPFVSRGGLKLAKAIDVFDINLEDKICIDIGASTGGFTDCMLQNGAKKIYCVDVGYGQLDWKLRNDPKIVNMEKVNIRYLEEDRISDIIDFVSIDVSFISLKLVLPVAANFLKEKGLLICLIKPQFEAGREQVGKKGIVRDKNVHCQVIQKVCAYGTENKLIPLGITFSPMTGAKGNIEYLILFKKVSTDLEIYLDESDSDSINFIENISQVAEEVVASAHIELGR